MSDSESDFGEILGLSNSKNVKTTKSKSSKKHTSIKTLNKKKSEIENKKKHIVETNKSENNSDNSDSVDEDLEFDDTEVVETLNPECESEEEQEEHDEQDEEEVFEYDTESMKRKLQQISQADSLPWIERLTVVSSEPTIVENVNDDTTRELAFYQQALEAVEIGREKITTLGIPFERPEDFFAEMIKTDQHMQKVRRTLIADRESIETSQQAKKQRELKKFAKTVQRETLERRVHEKKANIEKITKLRKQRKNLEDGNEFDVAIDDEEKGGFKRTKSSHSSSNPKRQKKDAKYGYGGQKRKFKKNDSDSVNDASSFSLAQQRTPFKGMKTNKGKSSKKTQRPGKNARKQNKQRK